MMKASRVGPAGVVQRGSQRRRRAVRRGLDLIIIHPCFTAALNIRAHGASYLQGDCTCCQTLNSAPRLFWHKHQTLIVWVA
jgi:hypothetical protein